jgi:hypothetical protein
MPLQLQDSIQNDLLPALSRQDSTIQEGHRNLSSRCPKAQRLGKHRDLDSAHERYLEMGLDQIKWLREFIEECLRHHQRILDSLAYGQAIQQHIEAMNQVYASWARTIQERSNQWAAVSAQMEQDNQQLLDTRLGIPFMKVDVQR